MKNIILILGLIFSLSINAQKKFEKVDAFDKSKVITYGYSAIALDPCPIVLQVFISGNGRDTTFKVWFTQSAYYSDYIASKQGKLSKFELMKSNGDLEELSAEDLVGAECAGTAMSSTSYWLFGIINLTPSLFQRLVGIKGFRIAGEASGTIFKFPKNKPNMLNDLLNLFLTDYPKFKE